MPTPASPQKTTINTELLLQKGATYRHAKAGEIIFNEDAPAAFYYQLVSGRIRWSHFDADGKEVLHKIIEPGEAFGELPLFDGQPYAASAMADSPCTILKLSDTSFHELLAAHPHIYQVFATALAAQLRFKVCLFNALAKNNPQTAIVEVINYLNRHGELICPDCNRLMVTRQQLANMMGMRVETIIRAIKQLQQEDKLCIVKGKVFLPEEEA